VWPFLIDNSQIDPTTAIWGLAFKTVELTGQTVGLTDVVGIHCERRAALGTAPNTRLSSPRKAVGPD